MEIEYVREFVTLAKCGNYMVAAEEMFISQSSLSKHIMTIEKELGSQLFNRTTRKVQLTRLGKAFLPYAQRIIEADSEFHSVLSAMKKEIKDSVQLGVLPAFIFYHVDEAVIEFKQKFPQFPISMVEGSNDLLLHYLKDGTCNLALVRTFDEPLPPDFVSIPLLKDHIALITTPGSFFDNGRTSVTWKELEAAELLTSTSPLQTKILDTFMKQSNIRLNIISRLSRTSSIVELLRKGIGNAALLNKAATEYYHDDEALKIIDIDPPIYNTVSLVYMKERPVTGAMRDFIDTVISYASRGEYVHA